MKNSKTRLAEITIELLEAKEIFRAKKKANRKIKAGTLEAQNARRELDSIKTGVQAIKQQQALIVEEFREEKDRI